MINIGLLKNFSRVRKYGKGAVFTAGEIYVILKGEVGVYTNHRKQDQQMIASMGPGDFFGDSALLAKRRTITTAAVTDVFAMPVDKSIIPLFAKGEPDMAAEIIKAMLARLDNLSAAYEEACGRPWVEPEHVPHAPAAQEEDEPEAKAVEPASKDSPGPAAEDAPLSFSLFPEEHGSYELPLGSQDKSCLMMKGYMCPVCRKEFKALKVKNSKLILDHTDNDMRNHYTAIEPLYYDVVTCPHCLYSALAEMFEKMEKPGGDLLKQLQAIKPGVSIRTGADMDTFSMLAGYYLALLCAPKCFLSPMLPTAKIYLKLSWLYHDCGDKNMEDVSVSKALESYIAVYEKGDMTGNVEQQLCLILGELYYRTNDQKNALEFLFKAKNAPNGAPLVKSRAEDRIFEIRGVE